MNDIFKVMLVDDDFPVLELLSMSVPWGDMGLRIVGTCENGQQAIDIAMGEMPDILITDIGMPFVDGIQLIRTLKVANPQMRTILLSCHDDFEYAQQAIKLNVHDYVLKETMKPDQITHLLRNIRDEILTERTLTNDSETLRRITMESHSQLREQFIRSIIHQPLILPIEWDRKALSYGIDFEKGPYLPVIGYIHRYSNMMDKFRTEDMLSFAVDNILDEVLSREQFGVGFRYSAGEFALLFPFEPSIKRNSFDDISLICKEIQSKLMQYLKVQTSFVMSDACRHSLELKCEFTRMLSNRSSRFYLKESSVHHIRTLATQFSTEDLFMYYTDTLDEITKAIVEESEIRIREIVDKWIQFLTERRFQPEVVKEWVLKIFIDLQIKFKTMHHFTSIYSGEKTHKAVYDMESIHEVRDWMIDRVVIFQSQIAQIFEQSKKREILEAQRFVHMNLDKKITLDMVVKHICLSKSYFCRMYKKETNENFMDFVIRTKMEKAKQWLNQSNKTVEEISHTLGYDDKRYFSQLFKDYTGKNPGEYGSKFQVQWAE